MSVEKQPVSSTDEQTLKRCQFLVVDDNAVNRKLLTIVLEKPGHSVDQADGGLEAIEAVKTKVYDAIFIDIHMPDLDGISAIAEIRKQPHYDDVPIIAITADSGYGDRERYLRQGADGYMTKPFDIANLHREWQGLVFPMKKTRPADTSNVRAIRRG